MVKLTSAGRYSLYTAGVISCGTLIYNLLPNGTQKDIKAFFSNSDKKPAQITSPATPKQNPQFPLVQFKPNGVDTIEQKLAPPIDYQNRFSQIPNWKKIDGQFTKDREIYADDQSGLSQAREQAGLRSHWWYRWGLSIALPAIAIILGIVARKSLNKDDHYGACGLIVLGLAGPVIDWIRGNCSKDSDKALNDTSAKKSEILNTLENKPASQLLEEYETTYKIYTTKLPKAYQQLNIRQEAEGVTVDKSKITKTENDINTYGHQLALLKTYLNKRADFCTRKARASQ